MLQTQGGVPNVPSDDDLNGVLFKYDRIYQHQLMRINYTTYDVRRSQDFVNASTAHCNVMGLADPSDNNPAISHPFKYARVLGIYHVNVVYVGPGMLNYEPHKLEFLWVRWYRTIETTRAGWGGRKLDRLQFAPWGADDAFGFLDPSDVLRSCHIIPAFATGKRHADRKSLSFLAHDSTDWTAYYVNR
jgi:hypothetical protein